MSQRSLFSLATLVWASLSAQVTVEFTPHFKAVSSIENGVIEAGPSWDWSNVSKGSQVTFSPYARMKLTDKDKSQLQIDRSTSDWTVVVEFACTKTRSGQNGPIRERSHVFAGEIGAQRFTYQPIAALAMSNETQMSYSGEWKLIWYHTDGTPHARQSCPQLRLRFTKAWEASKEVGLVSTADTNSITVVKEQVIAGPDKKTVFAPAFAYQFYPGTGDFSYSPALYYDASLTKGQSFNEGLHRVRFEFWTFFYPKDSDNPNVKLGIAPYASYRLAGMDDYNATEFGGLFTVHFKSSFFSFF